jgi:hypothetical protein
MPEKGWLKIVLEQARHDVNSRPNWEKDRVYGCRSTDSGLIRKKPRVTHSSNVEQKNTK